MVAYFPDLQFHYSTFSASSFPFRRERDDSLHPFALCSPYGALTPKTDLLLPPPVLCVYFSAATRCYPVVSQHRLRLPGAIYLWPQAADG